MLKDGDLLLLVHRRLFNHDHSRYFIGEVEDYADGLVRVGGYSWLRDPLIPTGYRRKEDLRTKIFSLSSGTVICYVLDANCDPHDLKIFSDEEGDTFLAEGRRIIMDLTEKHLGVNHYINPDPDLT